MIGGARLGKHVRSEFKEATRAACPGLALGPVLTQGRNVVGGQSPPDPGLMQTHVDDAALRVAREFLGEQHAI